MKSRIKFFYLKGLEDVSQADSSINAWLDTLDLKSSASTKFQVNFTKSGNKDLFDIICLTEYALTDKEIEK